MKKNLTESEIKKMVSKNIKKELNEDNRTNSLKYQVSNKVNPYITGTLAGLGAYLGTGFLGDSILTNIVRAVVGGSILIQMSSSMSAYRNLSKNRIPKNPMALKKWFSEVSKNRNATRKECMELQVQYKRALKIYNQKMKSENKPFVSWADLVKLDPTIKSGFVDVLNGTYDGSNYSNKRVKYNVNPMYDFDKSNFKNESVIKEDTSNTDSDLIALMSIAKAYATAYNTYMKWNSLMAIGQSQWKNIYSKEDVINGDHKSLVRQIGGNFARKLGLDTLVPKPKSNADTEESKSSFEKTFTTTTTYKNENGVDTNTECYVFIGSNNKEFAVLKDFDDNGYASDTQEDVRGTALFTLLTDPNTKRPMVVTVPELQNKKLYVYTMDSEFKENE